MNYKEVLQLIEYPSTVLVLDFESYFDQYYSFKKMSTIEYIQHRMFDFTGLGLQVLNPDYEPAFSGKDEIDSTIEGLQKSFGMDFDSITVVVLNAKFDITVLKEKFGINPPYIIDILDLARHYDSRMSHKLKDLAKMFGLKPKGDIQQFKGLHYEEMTDEQQIALAKYGMGDIDNERELFKILLPLLSDPIMEVSLARHTLGLFLNPRIKFDFQKAKELIGGMSQKLNDIIGETGYSKDELSGNKSFVELLKNALPAGEEVPMKPGKKGMIPALAQEDGGRKYLLAHPDEKVRQLMTARLSIKSWPLHLKRIRNMTDQAIASQSYLRVPLHYYGAHTGRWSGGEKINLQNLGGRGRVGSGVDPLISEMRQLLCTPDDYTFVISDSAQIEARVLAWLAGQEDLLDGFRNGEDIYSVFATKLFGVEVRKSKEDDSESDKRILKIRRGFGKDAILGCGYGMGAKTFYERCRQNPDLRPLFDSGEYTYKFIEDLIKTYRSTYKQIPAFWKVVEKCFKWVTKYPNEVIIYGHDHSTFPEELEKNLLTKALLTFWNNNGTVNLQLPSGRILYYRHAMLAVRGGYSTIKWHWGKLWGGSITENVVQAVARDLLGYWILELEKNNLPVVLHNHDETISLVPEANSECALGHALNLMSIGPDWSEGLPLGAEGEISGVYKK